MKKESVKEIAARYAKVVEWSEEDACYIGRVPALSYGGVHGKDRAKVFEEICRVAEEIVAIHQTDGRKLPDHTPRTYTGRFMLRISPNLHEALALKSEALGKSLNMTAAEMLTAGLAAS
ncbi:MAG: toxin-antitoxin system HicB family antitoxin [Chthoniobacterales bacterium]